MIKLVYVKRGDMMKKVLISLLSAGMLLGIFGVTEFSTGAPNVMEETVQADSTNNSKTINYEVYDENTNSLSKMNALFTKSATITPNDDGTYTVTIVDRSGILNTMTVSKIDDQTPKVDGKEVSFQIASLNDLDKDIPATVQTNALNLNLGSQDVTFRFDLSSMYTEGAESSFTDSLNKITHAENNITNGVNNAKSIVSSIKANADNNKVISTPNGTDTSTGNSANKLDPKTILKELTYNVLKNNGDGSLISPYFTNTAKLMQNPDGSHYIEATIKYPKKFGPDAFVINSINNQKPSNVSFRTEGDSNYITFDFPIKKLTDLSNLIPGNISMNIPDFGLNKDLGFNLNFDSLDPSDLSNLMSGTDSSGLSDLISSLGDLSDLGTAKAVTPVKSDTESTQNVGKLPQTGDATDNVLVLIGGLILVSTIALLKGTYFRNPKN